MTSLQGNVIFLRIFGIVFMILGWMPVLNPTIRVAWKGGNRAPLSPKSKWVTAFATTSWALIAWGVAPMFFAAVFASCVIYGMALSGQDRKRYDKETGVLPTRPIDPTQSWMVVSAFVAVLWILSLVVVVRDHYSPPAGRDAEFLRHMAWTMLGFFTLLAVLLYCGRPKKNPFSN